jgi:membrane-associated phospholipid phosphatase
MTLAVGTAVLRVLHTAHYLSDVLAGMGLGVALMRASLGYKLAGRMMLLAPERVRRWWLSDSYSSQ